MAMDDQERGEMSLKVRQAMPSGQRCFPAGEIDEPVYHHTNQHYKEILPKHIESNLSALHNSFKSVHKVVCLCPAKRSAKVDFGHFQTASRICSNVHQIQSKIEERLGLTLVRNCLLRLQASYRFTNELENVMEYYLTYLEDLEQRGSTMEREFSFKGHRFHELCLTAKDHLTFWSVFFERNSKGHWFKSVFSSLEHDMKRAHKSLLSVIRRFSVMISNILAYVLNTAYHLKWVMSDCLVKDISAAIEDMNRLSEYSTSIQEDNDVLFKTVSTSKYTDTLSCKMFGVCASIRHNSLDLSVSLQRLFNDTAKRRARLFCCHVFSFLHDQEDVCPCLNGDVKGELQGEMGNCHSKTQVLLDQKSSLASFTTLEHQFITELISKLATSTTLMSSYSMDRKLYMHKSLPEKGLYHSDEGDIHHTQDGIPCESHGSDSDGASHSILKHSPGSISPGQGKRVQWHHSIDVDSKAQVSVQYMDILWSRTSVNICQMLELLSWDRDINGVFGPLALWPDSVKMYIANVLQSLAKSDSIPDEESKCLELVVRYICCNNFLSAWDRGFCHLLTLARKDKCTTTSKQDIIAPSSITVQTMIQLFQMLRNFFEKAQNWNHHLGSCEYSAVYMIKDLVSSVLSALRRMHALVTFAISWMDTKLYHFLSGWNMSSFLMLVHMDLQLLVEAIQGTMTKLQPLCIGQSGNYSWELLPVQLEYLQTMVTQIQELGTVYKQLFQDDLAKMCEEFFQEAMPVGKSWKKSRQSGIPCKHNSYVEHAITQILEPVISGTELLSQEWRTTLLLLATTIMMETWSSYILKEEIVFSFYGAQQLQLDFNYIKCWISSDVSSLDTSFQSALLSLEVFHHLDGATRLLMLQPRKKKQMDELDVELESNISAVSSSSVLSSFSGVDIDSYEMDVLNDKTIPNKQLWLDLRLRGGKSKKGLLPFCLKVQEMK